MVTRKERFTPSPVGLTLKMKTQKAPVKVEQFDVVTPHVVITLRHLQKEVDYLKRHAAPISRGLGQYLHTTLLALMSHANRGESLESFIGSRHLGFQILVTSEMRGRKLSEIDLVMKKKEWEEVKYCARALDQKPQTLLRAAFRCRYLQLKEYNEKHGSTPETPPTFEKFCEVQGFGKSNRTNLGR